jgi:transcriptional regulator with XRE-family HTH domain
MAYKDLEIAARIKELRAQRGNPPQEAMAQRLGISMRTYQNWESGAVKPAYRNLETLAAFHGVSEDYILSGRTENDETPTPDMPEWARRLEEKLDLLLSRVPTAEARIPAPPGELGRIARGEKTTRAVRKPSKTS